MATAIVVGLGALVAVLIQSDPVPTTTTIVITTTTTSAPTTTTSAASTSTTTPDQRLAEVETILQELWFGWFDAIYRKDADALWEVVATTPRREDGLRAMEALDFIAPPAADAVTVVTSEILLDRPDCLVVDHAIDLSPLFGPDSVAETVSVLWSDSRYGWRFATNWENANDLWLIDCDSMEREVTP
jgi:hypothetical protein